MTQPQTVSARHPIASALLLAIGAVIVIGCAAGSAASAPPPGTVTSPDRAAALVIATDRRFGGLQPQDRNQIGQCCYYQANGSQAGYDVTVVFGWGDCPAGCMNTHRWFYAVTSAGIVTLQREEGVAVPAGFSNPAAGGGGGILPGGSGIDGRATMGPTCPVVKVGDPACDDRPVAGATVLVRDAGGNEVARLTTDADGRFRITLPPGPYQIEAQPLKGIMGTPSAITVTVGGAFVPIQLSYDTGIR